MYILLYSCITLYYVIAYRQFIITFVRVAKIIIIDRIIVSNFVYLRKSITNKYLLQIDNYFGFISFGFIII